MIVLHDMPAPPLGVNWVPGTTSPEWVIKVTSALAADSEVSEGESVGRIRACRPRTPSGCS